MTKLMSRATSDYLAATPPDRLFADLAHALTFEDMRRALDGRAGVLRYSDAFRCDAPDSLPLRQLLEAYPDRAVVFLYRETPAYGHYILIWEQNKDTVAVMDPYGVEPDLWGAGRSPTAQEKLGQHCPALLDSVYRAGYKRMAWNEHPLQQRTPLVQTCGRWSIMRLMWPKASVEDFARAVSRAAEKNGVTPDVVAVACTEPLIR